LVVAAGPTSHVRSVASKRPPAPTPSYHADTHPDLFGTEAPCVVGLADSLRVRHTAIPHAASRGSPPPPAPTDASAHTRSHTHNTDTGNRKRAGAKTQSQRAHPAPSLIREASSPGMSGARQPPRAPESEHRGCWEYSARVAVSIRCRGGDRRVARGSPPSECVYQLPRNA